MLMNASPLEVAYTLPSVCGLLVAVALLYMTVKDEIRRRQHNVNGVVRLDIQKSLVTAVILCWALAALSLIGVNAMVTPPNPNLIRDPTTASTATVNALLFVSVDVALIALACYRMLQRGAVQRAIEHEAAGHPHRRAGDE